MDLSVVICTWNNCNRLAITLNSLSHCVIPQALKWELVLVNNNCTDETDQVAQQFTDKLPLVYIHEPQQGLSRARNAGLKAASGDLILFTDDDVKPSPNWIKIYWSAYQERPRGFYFGGPIESEFEGFAPESQLLGWAPPSVRGLNWGDRPRRLSSKEYFISANWACPQQELNAVGGFDIHKGLNASLRNIHIG